jgi:hypothetical protein
MLADAGSLREALSDAISRSGKIDELIPAVRHVATREQSKVSKQRRKRARQRAERAAARAESVANWNAHADTAQDPSKIP